MGKSKKQRHNAESDRKIIEGGIYPLEPSEKYSLCYYYFFKTTNSRERIIGRVYDWPIYDLLKDQIANFMFGSSQFDNMLNECDKPSRYLGSFTDRELGVKYIIRVTPSYIPSIWIRFNRPTPFAKALKTVDKLYIKAHEAARKYAKEDGFID